MGKTYVTFGQTHRHVIEGNIFDRDCVAVLDSKSWENGQAKARERFGPQYCFDYYDTPPNMKHFPRGFIDAE